MLGHTHALGGAVAFLAAAPVIERFVQVNPGGLLAGTVVAAGAALLPDLDSHGATIARTYGPVTEILARVIAFVSGGHRNGTHSLMGLAVFTGIATGLMCWGGYPLAALLWLLFGVSARGLGVTARRHQGLSELFNAAIMAGAAVAFVRSGVDLALVPIGVGLGVAAHIVADCVTEMGCPLAWPFSQRMLGLPLVDTGSFVERKLLTPGFSVAVPALAVLDLGAWPHVLGWLRSVG